LEILPPSLASHPLAYFLEILPASLIGLIGPMGLMGLIHYRQQSCQEISEMM
jgi:hypothetical protein